MGASVRVGPELNAVELRHRSEQTGVLVICACRSLGCTMMRSWTGLSQPAAILAGGSRSMVEMTVESVRINLATNQRVVILKDAQGERYLFIWIANPEAYSIAMELQ